MDEFVNPFAPPNLETTGSPSKAKTGVIATAEGKKIADAFRVMDADDRQAFRNTLENQLTEVRDALVEETAQLEGLEETIKGEKSSRLIRLVKTTGKFKGEVGDLTVRQYRELVGREPYPTSLTPDREHVRWEDALDSMAPEMGYEDAQSLKDAIEKVKEQTDTMADLRMLKQIAKDRIYQIERNLKIIGEIERTPTGGTIYEQYREQPKEPERPVVEEAPAVPESERPAKPDGEGEAGVLGVVGEEREAARGIAEVGEPELEPSPFSERPIKYKNYTGATIKTKVGDAQARLAEVKDAIALQERRLERLKATKEKKPEWEGYDPMVDEMVSIDIRLEEQKAYKEMLEDEQEAINKALETEEIKAAGEEPMVEEPTEAIQPIAAAPAEEPEPEQPEPSAEPPVKVVEVEAEARRPAEAEKEEPKPSAAVVVGEDVPEMLRPPATVKPPEMTYVGEPTGLDLGMNAEELRQLIAQNPELAESNKELLKQLERVEKVEGEAGPKPPGARGRPRPKVLAPARAKAKVKKVIGKAIGGAEASVARGAAGLVRDITKKLPLPVRETQAKATYGSQVAYPLGVVIKDGKAVNAWRVVKQPYHDAEGDTEVVFGRLPTTVYEASTLGAAYKIVESISGEKPTDLFVKAQAMDERQSASAEINGLTVVKSYVRRKRKSGERATVPSLKSARG